MFLKGRCGKYVQLKWHLNVKYMSLCQTRLGCFHSSGKDGGHAFQHRFSTTDVDSYWTLSRSRTSTRTANVSATGWVMLTDTFISHDTNINQFFFLIFSHIRLEYCRPWKPSCMKMSVVTCCVKSQSGGTTGFHYWRHVLCLGDAIMHPTLCRATLAREWCIFIMPCAPSHGAIVLQHHKYSV